MIVCLKKFGGGLKVSKMIVYWLLCEDGTIKPGHSITWGGRNSNYRSEGRSPQYIRLVVAMPGYEGMGQTLEINIKNATRPYREWNSNMTDKLEKIAKKYKRKITMKWYDDFLDKQLKNLPGLYKVKDEFCSPNNPIEGYDDDLGSLYKRIVALPEKYLEGYKND